jgi:hypothetical protein
MIPSHDLAEPRPRGSGFPPSLAVGARISVLDPGEETPSRDREGGAGLPLPGGRGSDQTVRERVSPQDAFFPTTFRDRN